MVKRRILDPFALRDRATCISERLSETLSSIGDRELKAVEVVKTVDVVNMATITILDSKNGARPTELEK